jgi:hypothetical protein
LLHSTVAIRSDSDRHRILNCVFVGDNNERVQIARIQADAQDKAGRKPFRALRVYSVDKYDRLTVAEVQG